MDHMAIDQYGQTEHALGEHPRKALLERMGRKHASKMYRDGPDGCGRSYHVGYVIAGRWFTIYEVKPMRK